MHFIENPEYKGTVCRKNDLLEGDFTVCLVGGEIISYGATAPNMREDYAVVIPVYHGVRCFGLTKGCAECASRLYYEKGSLIFCESKEEADEISSIFRKRDAVRSHL
jgi:hypothetical protein